MSLLSDFLISVLRTRGAGATVAVLLRWDPPTEGDLPVHNYRVTWMSRQTHTVHKHTHTLHGRAHTVHNNMHSRPTHPRAPEQGKKESNSRATQGVSKLSMCSITLHNRMSSLSLEKIFHFLFTLLCQSFVFKLIKLLFYPQSENVTGFWQIYLKSKTKIQN